ncbi:hypothetical protein MKX01_001406 [Papaver californicum]|nr:hypothetical protein MKX01_001406 [Papaver californicum]
MDEMHLFNEDELKKMNELSSSPSPSSSVLPPAQDLLSQMILFCNENDDHENVEDICADINENDDKKTKTFVYAKYLADLVFPIICQRTVHQTRTCKDLQLHSSAVQRNRSN